MHQWLLISPSLGTGSHLPFNGSVSKFISLYLYYSERPTLRCLEAKDSSSLSIGTPSGSNINSYNHITLTQRERERSERRIQHKILHSITSHQRERCEPQRTRLGGINNSYLSKKLRIRPFQSTSALETTIGNPYFELQLPYPM